MMGNEEPPSGDEVDSLPFHLRAAIRLAYPKRAEAEDYENCVLHYTNTTLATKGRKAALIRMHKEACLACFPVWARWAKNAVLWFLLR